MTDALTHNEAIQGISIFIIQAALKLKREDLYSNKSILELCGDIIEGKHEQRVHESVNHEVMDCCINWLVGGLDNLLDQEQRFSDPSTKNKKMIAARVFPSSRRVPIDKKHGDKSS